MGVPQGSVNFSVIAPIYVSYLIPLALHSPGMQAVCQRPQDIPEDQCILSAQWLLVYNSRSAPSAQCALTEVARSSGLDLDVSECVAMRYLLGALNPYFDASLVILAHYYLDGKQISSTTQDKDLGVLVDNTHIRAPFISTIPGCWYR